jgi:hypothetical protein
VQGIKRALFFTAAVGFIDGLLHGTGDFIGV